ncbi:MAG TPA: protein translocase subunit SecD [Rickettsiales bacterium]|nr:protein translocase subunit SecD [Rickettsiales bacterium]
MEFSKIKIAFILLVCFFSVLIGLGNFFNLGMFSNSKVHLGLDLKGGSQILLKIDYDNYVKEQLVNTIAELKTEFRKNQIRTIPQLKINTENGEKESYIYFVLTSESDLKEIKKIVKNVNPDLNFNRVLSDISLKYSKDTLEKIKYKLLEQSIQIVRKRIDETGTKEPIIQAQGRDRILVQVPGMESPDELKQVLGKTAKMTFHFVNTDIIKDGILPPNVEKMKEMNGEYYYNVDKTVILNGDLLQDANATYSEGQPAVSFKFNTLGARKFADITRENVGRILAIVLDNEVITAPRINTPIMGGNGIISGNFTTEEANQVALLLRAGALPAPLEIIEERVVGPSLGQDSIRSGLHACVLGFLAVLLFMIIFYKLLGLLTTITLMVNLFLMLGILSLFNATLTLPGIAGIVLSIGMAVDTNVLIFERIREEYIASKKVYNSVVSGFEYAWATIFDSNITTLLIALILFVLGTGPVKGFALVLGIGIIASLFSGVLLTKLLLSIWLNKFQPRKITIWGVK